MTRVRYILEYGEKNLVNETKKVILPYVANVDFSREHAEVTTWTMGEHPVHHYAGIRSQMIKFSGRSGVATRFETSGITSAPAADQSGPALFRKFEEFLEEYETLARDAMRQNEKPPKMTLRMLFEKKKLSVEPKNIDWRRSSATSRFSYEYDLTLEAHGLLKFEEAAGPLGALTSAFEVSNTITRGINTAGIAVARANELLEDTKTQLDTFREPLKALTRLGSQARQFSRSADALVQWPKAFMTDFWFATFELTSAMFDSWATLDYIDRQAVRSEMIDALSSMNDAKRATQAALGLNFVTLPGKVSTYEAQIGLLDGTSDPSYTTRQRAITSFDSLPGGYAVKNGQLVQVYEVIAGDTIQGIAGKKLGDRSRWTEIADLNGVTSANVFSDGSPLIGGSVLFVPAPNGAQLPGLSPGDLYGVDLQLGPDGDFIGVGSSPEDVAVIRGVDNLVQGLTNRLITVQGDNATFPDHGLPQLIGNPGTEDRIADAAIETDLQFRRDQRIESIQDLVILDEGDELIVRSVLKPVIGKAFDVTVPFPTS